jgi:tight adherence protein B
MNFTIIVVFLGVFLVVALVAIAFGSGASQEAKQVHATLDSALATESQEARDQVVDLRKVEQFSSIPWLNGKMLKFDVAPRLQALLYQADLKWTPGTLLAGSAFGFFVGGFLAKWRFNSYLVACGVGLAVAFLPFAWVLRKRTARLNKFQQGLPESLDLMVSALRAGHSLVAAIGSVARECPDPLGCEFKTCFEEQNYGLELKTALENLINRVPLQDLRIVATAIMIQKESGGNLAEVLDKTSHVIRERFRLKRQVGVHTAQGRMTGIVLTLLPVVLGFLLYLVSPSMMSILWTNPMGVKLMWIAAGMILIGGLIIRNIVNMDV